MAQISLDSIKKSKNTATQFTIKSTRLIRLLKRMVKNMCRSTLMAALVVRIQRRLANHSNLIERPQNFW